MSETNFSEQDPEFVSDASEAQKLSTKSKSLTLAYLLTITLGWLGVHRFYLGNVLLGLLYMFSLGGLGIGILLDLIFLPRLVRKANQDLQNSENFDDILIDEADIEYNTELNPLRSSFFLLRWSKYFFFVLFLILTPYMFYDFFGDMSFAAILFLLYFVAVFNRWFAARMADKEFIVWRIPGVRSRMVTILNGFAKLRRYYASRPYVGFFRSMLSVFLIPFSKEVQREWKLFNGLLAFGMIFVIIQFAGWGVEYFTLYKPQLGIGSLLQVKINTMVVSAIFTLMLVIPVLRTLTYVELAGDAKQGRLMVALAFVGVFAFPFLSATESYPHEEFSRLKQRLTKSKIFAKAFHPYVDQFFKTHYKPSTFSTRVTNDGKKNVEYKTTHTRLALATSIRLTRKFRQELVKKKIVLRSEVNGFRVFAFDSKDEGRWRTGLLAFAAYGTGEPGSTKVGGRKKLRRLHWAKLRTAQGWEQRADFVSTRELELLYRVLLSRMKNMNKGDQLSPDFKGRTPDIRAVPPTQTDFRKQTPIRRSRTPKLAPPRARKTPKKNRAKRRKALMKEGDDDDDDDDDDEL